MFDSCQIIEEDAGSIKMKRRSFLLVLLMNEMLTGSILRQ